MVLLKNPEPCNVGQVLAKKFGAAVVSLEHRYYGKSSPFKSLRTENLKYLSSKQALSDLAVFRQYYQASSLLITIYSVHIEDQLTLLLLKMNKFFFFLDLKRFVKRSTG